MPARTFFLDVPPAVSFARGSKAEAGDRIEREEADFHERVYRGYLELAERWPGRITRIDASGTKEATQKQIRQAAQAVLRAEGILHA